MWVHPSKGAPTAKSSKRSPSRSPREARAAPKRPPDKEAGRALLLSPLGRSLVASSRVVELSLIVVRYTYTRPTSLSYSR